MLNISSDTDQVQGVSIIKVEGRVDSETAPQLEEALAALLNTHSNKIVVNLQGVDHMSSAGLRAIVKAYQQAENAGGSVRLAAVPQVIESILFTVGLNQMLIAYPTSQEAMAGF